MSRSFSDILGHHEFVGNFPIEAVIKSHRMWFEMFVKFKNNLFCFIHQYLETNHVCYKHCFEINFRLQNISPSVNFKGALQKRMNKNVQHDEENRYL